MPNYKKIYTDLICEKYSEKMDDLLPLLKKKRWTSLDVINIDKALISVSDNDKDVQNNKFRSYNKAAILKILEYQKIHNCNNISVAQQFNLSRNTITKWKKIFIV